MTAADLHAVKSDVAALELRPADSFRLAGEEGKPDAAGHYPMGTQATYTMRFRGVHLAIPVVVTEEGWKVDVRFWVAMLDSEESLEESSPEVVVRKFLYYLLARRTADLKTVTPAGAEVRALLKGQAPREDSFYAPAIAMPVVPAREGEGMKFPSGEVLRAGPGTRDTKWMVGLYGPNELLFELRKERGAWKVIPRDYLTPLGLGDPTPPSVLGDEY